MKLITTSWDDGHPLDFKLAAMLDKYQLAATFYIPKKNEEHEVMNEKDMQQLSKKFEIGAHTLNHLRLNTKDKNEISKEVYGSFLWLEDLLGYKPVSFCFPGGKYNALSIEEVFKSGFTIARTTELLCTKINESSQLMATTVQVYEHGLFTYMKHLLKRKRFASLIQMLVTNSAYSTLKLTENYIRCLKDDNIFHLWGHSWEIEQYNLWKKLEAVFELIAYNTDCLYVQNKQVVKMIK